MALIGQAVSEEKKFEIVDGRRTEDAGALVYYKLTGEPEGSGELKIEKINQILFFFHVMAFFFHVLLLLPYRETTTAYKVTARIALILSH